MKVQWRDGKARFTCDTFAWMVCLDLDGGVPLADNFFDILPGVHVEMSWPAEWGKPKIRHLGNHLAGLTRQW